MSSATKSASVLIPTLRGGAALFLIVLALTLVETMELTSQSGGALFALGFLLIAGTVGGRVATLFRLPKLTGYLAVGVLSGPYGFELFSKSDVTRLMLINGLALALIALQAGAELTIPMLKRSLKSLIWASVGHSLIITLGVGVLFAFCLGFTSFGKGLPMQTVLAIGLLWGAMACSKAPADTLAILSETKAKGPLSEHALGVVVLLDVLVLVLFAVALMIAKSSVDPSAHISMHEFTELGVEIFASVAAGTTFGLAIAFYFWAIGREKVLFTIVVAYGVTAFCAYFHYDTLLVFVVAGFVVMNMTREGHELIHTTESVGSAVMVVFFATAGAQLDLGALKEYWIIATALAFGRILFTWLACQFGHWLSGDGPMVKKYAFTSFISQAGVTIGLAAIAKEAIGGELGTGIATLVIAVIGINELIGPVAFKIGLIKSGEVGKGDEQDEDHEGDEPPDPELPLVDSALSAEGSQEHEPLSLRTQKDNAETPPEGDGGGGQKKD